MKEYLNKLLRDDEGAVTVDWVVLTAAVVGLAVAIVVALTNGSAGVSAGVEEFMKNWSF